MHYATDIELAHSEPRSRLRWLVLIPVIAMTFIGLAPAANTGEVTRHLVPAAADAP